MNISKEASELLDEVVKFLAVLLECLDGTSYTSDRPVYLRDIATTSSWIVDLYRGVEAKAIAENITSSSTSKQFGDYFRQGEWGDKEAKALKVLQDYAKKLT